jgi:hypothetical protein
MMFFQLGDVHPWNKATASGVYAVYRSNKATALRSYADNDPSFRLVSATTLAQTVITQAAPAH